MEEEKKKFEEFLSKSSYQIFPYKTEFIPMLMFEAYLAGMAQGVAESADRIKEKVK